MLVGLSGHRDSRSGHSGEQSRVESDDSPHTLCLSSSTLEGYLWTGCEQKLGDRACLRWAREGRSGEGHGNLVILNKVCC